MTDKIKCPICGYTFDVEEALSGKLEAHFKAEYESKIAKQEETSKEMEVFKRFADTTIEGFGMADFNTNILYMNKGLHDLHGFDESHLNTSFLRLYPNNDVKRLTETILPEVRKTGQWKGELNLLTANGKMIPTRHNFFLIRDENGQPFRFAAVITDITEMKEANERLEEKVKERTLELEKSNTVLSQEIKNRISIENELRKSEKKFRNIFDSSSDGIIIADLNHCILEYNQAMSEIFGVDSNDAINKKIYDFILPEDIPKVQDRLKHMLNNENVSSLEILIIKSDRSSVPIEVNSKLIDYMGNKAILTIVRDITERKLIEQKILQTIIQTEEKERSRFAKELHDGIGPLLSATKIYAKAIHTPENKDDQAYSINKLEETINEAITSAQEISNNISPHVLRNFGLKIAIDTFFNKIYHNTKISFNFNSNIKDRFDENIETTLYRITVELIHNTLKHAQASEIKINLMFQNNLIIFNYSDNGDGFDLQRILKESTGMGLSNIQSRIKPLNGTVNINSKEGKGMEVKIQIKL